MPRQLIWLVDTWGLPEHWTKLKDNTIGIGYKEKHKSETCRLLQPISPGEPFDRVGIDLLGPFPKTSRGNRYCETHIDYGTRWAETQAGPTENAQEVTQFLLDSMICRHCTPNSIYQERLLVLRWFMSYYSSWIQRTMPSSYWPQCNGAVEQLHATLTTMILNYLSSNHRDWDTILLLVTFYHNISRHESTGFSPFLLLYSHEPILPSEVCFNQSRGR
ncbi:hypothetical protein PR048_015900 [Dryococelus australis]|uniref:Integrase catalytic domain-containing protein n=1 Tax=Dryococelus australis TaxID=614101 RepID=A0ABQ9HI98_9NEOP|nr:hypothetical protein PR048_015900 [Dryococelus australis]